MRVQLGVDGFSEAMNRRWIVPNYETGELKVNEDAAILEDIRNEASKAPYSVGDPVVVVDNGESYVGVVSKVGEQGKYSVSFNDQRKPSTTREYASEEMSKNEQGEDQGHKNPVTRTTPASDTLNSSPLHQ